MTVSEHLQMHCVYEIQYTLELRQGAHNEGYQIHPRNWWNFFHIGNVGLHQRKF